jgi:hypothetical protein
MWDTSRVLLVEKKQQWHPLLIHIIKHQQHQYQNTINVAESLGNIAEGLLHLAKEQYEVHIDSKAYYKQFSHGHQQQQLQQQQQHQYQQQCDHHYHHHPLQQSDNSIIASSHSRQQIGFSSSHPTAQGEDTISIAYRPQVGVPNQQQQPQSNVNVMTNVIVDKIGNFVNVSCM